ncbi:MAG: TonB-dependent receptor [Pseudomonadota bacterium]|nr:TonB-dependent receptor [Pseudomonadota bacterium]
MSGHDGAHWREVQLDQVLCAGQQVRLMDKSRAVLHLPNETLIHFDERSVFTLRAIEPEKPASLDLLRGALHTLSRVPRVLNIRTPFANVDIDGTEFALQVGNAETALWVYEGRVRFSNTLGQLLIASGEAAAAAPGRGPERRIVVKPRRAVEWALYYPPLLDTRPERYPEPLRAALAAYRQNDLPTAFARLESLLPEDHSGRFFTLRAGLLLSVGRVAEAEKDIVAALKRNPKDGTALALRAVIAVVRNETEEALRLAQEAVTAEPRSPTPYVARSYAEQSAFDIASAQKSLEEASRLAPEDALIWARLAEIELSLGDLDAALEAARKAEQLDPGLSRTQSVLGFAYLTRIEVDRAKTAFERALVLDPADPLPRLGLGLARIRDGDIDAGIKEIETAASLDPNNSLVRSYLGKAYYEQKRGGLASTEFEQAKLLDPKDPTPWFYDAIQKQTTNRPVEALHDLQKAIELNDNRAVYRSRLLLDEDLATRNTSLGRIYTDLGFQQLAVVESAKSLSLDPANHSAHRLLSDSYLGLTRHEIARGSELLQSRLLQPITSNPVRPSRSASDIRIAGGAGLADAGFNEFSPLFERNRVRLLTSAFGGNHGTWGEETVLSALYDRYAVSLGQLHSDTEGFRPNNDLKQDLYDVFAQVAIAPFLDIQGEYRLQDREQGDLRLNFATEIPFDIRRQTIAEESGRIGVHLRLSPHSDVLISGLYGDIEERRLFSENDGLTTEVLQDQTGYQFDAQYLFRTEHFNLAAGGNVYHTDVDISGRFFDTEGNGAPLSPDSFARDQHTAYIYSHIDWPPNLFWTLGVSYDSYDERDIDVSALHPKIGLQWNVTDSTQMRMAYFETLRPAVIIEQTLEPAEIAGFNQFFDDPPGTQAKRYGIGIDQRFSESFYVGLEASRRDIELPLVRARDEELSEKLFRAYAYWTLSHNWTISNEYRFDQFEVEEPHGFPEGRVMLTETTTVPVTLRYFHGAGFFAGLSATYVQQEVELLPFEDTITDTITKESGSDNFVTLDMAIGYRLPKRLGILSVGVSNLLDEKFRFQDDNFRTSTPIETNGRSIPDVGTFSNFIPDRTIFAGLTLSF